jgi:hypothetical protein
MVSDFQLLLAAVEFSCGNMTAILHLSGGYTNGNQ